MYKTFADAEAAGAARYGWTCPECGMHGGTMHLATCRFIRSQEQYDAIQDEIEGRVEIAVNRARGSVGNE